jgi:hypothetical protein
MPQLKKIFVFTLIAVLLFNVMGYYGLFLGLQYQNGIAMKKRIDSNQYDESQTLTIKIPMAVPYMSDNPDFERVDGIFEYNGEFYRFVKQKYARDTVTIVCIKDQENKRITDAITDYVKTFSNTPAHQQQHSKLLKTHIKDYIPQTCSLKPITSGWENDVTGNDCCNDLIPSFEVSVIHPPERS